MSLDIDEKLKEGRLGERSERVQWIIDWSPTKGKRNTAHGKDAQHIEGKEWKVDEWLRGGDWCAC